MDKRKNPPEIVDFSYEEKTAKNLREYIGKIVIIQDAVIKNTRKGEMTRLVICEVNERGECKDEVETFTFSRVIADQVRKYILPLLQQGKFVKVKIEQSKKGYLHLAPPK